MFGAAFPLAPIGASAGGGGPIDGLWRNGYRYRIRRVIPAAIHQMPTGGFGWVKFRITSANLRSVANGGNVANDADWPDIRFENGAGVALDWELESWNATTGALVAWPRLTGFVANVSYAVLLYYGKAGITADEANPIGCWAGFAQSVNMATGLDMTGNDRHFTLDDVAASTIFGGAAGDFT